MQHGWRIAAVLAIAAVSTIAEAAAAPALSVSPVPTPVPTAPDVTVAPLTATVPNVPAPTVTPVSPPPVVSSPPTVSLPSGGSGGGGSGSSGGGPVGGVVNGVTQALPGPGGGSGGSGGGGGSGSSGGGGGSVGGVVNGVEKSLPAVNGGKPSTGPVGTVVGGATGGGYSTPGSGNSAVSPVFGGTPGGPGGGQGAGGLGSPTAFALGIQRGTATGNGSGGVSAFAAAVGSLAGCFYALTPYEQQVLTVRTGIDGRRALSRNQLAALLGTSPAAIGAIEQNALGELRKAAQTDGCMPVGAAGPANALTAFIGGPFGPIGYVTPAVPLESRAAPGGNPAQQARLATTSFADKLAILDNANGQASLSVLVIIALMLSAALAALLVEARRSVH